MRSLFFALLALALFATEAHARPIATGKASAVRDGKLAGCSSWDANAVPYAPPSSARPWGSVITGCFREPDSANRAVVVEWDLAAGKPVRERELTAPDGANQIRVARSSPGVVVALSIVAYEALVDSQLVLLDDAFKVRQRWVFPSSSSADLSAHGELGAASFYSPTAPGKLPVLLAVTFDTRRAVQLRQRRFRQRGSHMPEMRRPYAELRVRKRRVHLSVGHEDSFELLALGPDLGRPLARFEHRPAPHGFGVWTPSQAWLALTARGAVVGLDERLFELDGNLRTIQRHIAARRRAGAIEQDGQLVRGAIDPGSGRVALEDGRVAPKLGAPLVPALSYTGERVGANDKLAFYADQTSAITWAFGRAVIVRDAPALALTVIEP
jgi:hypothetical protein